MQSKIPSSTKRSYTFIAGLDGTGLLIVGSGFFASIGIIHESWSIYFRIPVILVIALITAALAWGKWPAGEYGDRVGVWAQRIMHYYQDERKTIKYWTPSAPMTPPQAPSSTKEPTKHRKGRPA